MQTQEDAIRKAIVKYNMSKYLTSVDLAVDVEYEFYPASRGARDSLGGKRGAGPPLEPDEPEHIEITDVLHNGESIINILSDTVMERLTDRVEENIADQRADAPEDV